MKHKRRWTWREKHVRKHRSNKRVMTWYTPPKWCRAIYHRGDRTKVRIDIAKVMRGIEDVNFGPKYHPSAAKWDWT